jgi:hypothetical protein
MKEPLFSSHYCVNHAERRLTELIGIVNTFIESSPCETVNELDTNTGENVLKIKLVKPMPIEIPGIVFDILSCLRAALDHAGYACAIAGGKTGYDALFPFGDCLSEIVGKRNVGKGRSIDIPDQIFQVMLGCKPYRGGNDHLWAMNKLCNANKHELVIPFAMGAVTISFTVSRGKGPTFSAGNWDREKNEREIARSCFGSEFQDHCQASTYVVFDKFDTTGDLISFQSIVPVLERMLETVRDTIFAIQNEASRIGLTV